MPSRGQNPMEITNAFNKVKNISRNDARTKSSGSKEGEKRHRFFTKFNPHHPNVLRIIKKHEHLLQTNATLAKLFPQGSFQVVNKREKNLKELIARADPYCVNQKSVGKYSTCEKVRCDSCNIFAQECTKFKCQATGRQYMINKKMSCNTPNVIYLAQCEKCKVQGVGSTTKWKPRLRNYKSWVKNKTRLCRIANHFIDSPNCRGAGSKPWENMKFKIIDCLENVHELSPEQIELELLKKEKFWIRSLLTYHHGLNSSHDLNRTNRCEREKVD